MSSALEVLRDHWPISTNDAVKECKRLGIPVTADGMAALRRKFRDHLADALREGPGYEDTIAGKFGRERMYPKKAHAREGTPAARAEMGELMAHIAGYAYDALADSAQEIIDTHNRRAAAVLERIEAASTERDRGKAIEKAKRDAREAARQEAAAVARAHALAVPLSAAEVRTWPISEVDQERVIALLGGGQ